MDICESLCHSFDFVNMRFVIKVNFFTVNFYEKIYFHRKFITNVCYSLDPTNSFLKKTIFSHV